MGSVRRTSLNQYLVFLGLNVVVSAITVVLVLSLWDRRPSRETSGVTATVDVIAQVASAIPTVTPSPVPTATPITYLVRAGDTLTEIAMKFGVPVEDLMEANELRDANTLSAGQLLIIPPSALLPLGASGGQGEIPGDATPTPEALEPLSLVMINGVEGKGDLAAESVRLLNTGGEVAMAGWTLDDGEGTVYTFPAFTFYTTGAVDVHTRSGNDTSIDLYWGLNKAIWTPGKVISLRDASGRLQSTFRIPEG